MVSRIAIGSDHIGFALKEVLKVYLGQNGYQIRDFGCDSSEPVDYPDVAFEVARAVASGDFDRAVLICGTGIGMAIAANKVPGVFAAVVHDPYSAARARMSNDAQIATFGARVVAPELAESLLRTWLESEFAAGASARKVDKIRRADLARVPPKAWHARAEALATETTQNARRGTRSKEVRP